MRIRLLQLEVTLAEPFAERVQRVAEQIRGCTGVDLVVLPELWAHGAWDYSSWAETAEPLDGLTVSALGAAARDAGVLLHGGSIVERHGDQLFNTAILIGDQGELRACYRKIHRFGFGGGEAKLLSPGEEFLTISGLPLTMGVATCYDLRFPELFRRLTDAGAQMFVVASSWPHRRLDHWRLLTRARAVENLAWLVAADACGEHGGVRQAGHSVVVDPWGTVLAEAGPDPTVLDVDVDPDRVREVRESFPALRDRRLS